MAERFRIFELSLSYLRNPKNIRELRKNAANVVSMTNPMMMAITRGLMLLWRRLPSGATGIGVPGPYRAGAATCPGRCESV